MLALSDLARPVVVAPMAGGPSTPALVAAAAAAGGLGFLAGGYRTAQDLMGQVATVRGTTETFGVNLFVADVAGAREAIEAGAGALVV